MRVRGSRHLITYSWCPLSYYYMNSIHYKTHKFGIGMVVCCWNCNRLLFIQTPRPIDDREIIYMMPFAQRGKHRGFTNEKDRHNCRITETRTETKLH